MRDDADLELTGHLGLDLVNTVVRTRTGFVDLLASPGRFLEWMELAGGEALAGLAPSDPPGRRHLTARAAELREALRSLFSAVSDGGGPAPPPGADLVIDLALRAAPRVHRLEGGVLVSAFVGRGPLAPLTPIALSAMEMVADVDPDRLRPCAADDCPRWFVDTSKGGQRRWCSMASCGNRAKAARYRARHAEPA